MLLLQEQNSTAEKRQKKTSFFLHKSDFDFDIVFVFGNFSQNLYAKKRFENF